jgi:hypothetical protein
MEATLLEVPFIATAQTSVSSVVITQLTHDTDLAIDTAQSFVGMVQPISQTILNVAATTVTGQATDRLQRSGSGNVRRNFSARLEAHVSWASLLGGGNPAWCPHLGPAFLGRGEGIALSKYSPRSKKKCQ